MFIGQAIQDCCSKATIKLNKKALEDKNNSYSQNTLGITLTTKKKYMHVTCQDKQMHFFR
jgi:hypothetical protein